jgi:hypothetical protein
MFRLTMFLLMFASSTALASTTTITFSESQSTATGFNGQSNPYLTSSDGEYKVEFYWLNTGGHDHVSSGAENNHDNSRGTQSSAQGIRITRTDGGSFSLDSMSLAGEAAVGTLSDYSTGAGSYTLYTNSSGTVSFGSSYTGTHVVIADPGIAGGSDTSNSWDDIVLSTYPDDDNDGYTSDVDCDDSDASINPGATEYCDTVDNNCDGTIDEDTAIDAVTWYADADNDGYGDASTTDVECYQPTGYVADNTDCNDSNSTTYPTADEYCDGVDNNCTGTTDEDTAVDVLTWYADTDSDGYGDAASTDIDCYLPTGYVADDTDCDDTDADTYPGAEEWCDGHDDNCDGITDEDDAMDSITWYVDTDGDGEGDSTISADSCYGATGYVENSTDCDDNDPSLNTADADTDGYTSCDSDCNDTDGAINIDATEIWYDGVDQNCDTWSDYDQDADGFDHLDYDADGDGIFGDDCDDLNPDINVDAAEIWYDGTDQDCDTLSDYDADYDGQESETYGGVDCNDADPDTYTGAPDTPYDGVINDCDNANDYDADGDGVLAADYGGKDCDDANSDINPSAEEIWYDGVDQDCDGNDDDQDGDGYALDDDCDDENADVFENCDADTGGGDTGGSDTGNGYDTLDKDSGGCFSSTTGGKPVGPWALMLAGLLFFRRKKD